MIKEYSNIQLYVRVFDELFKAGHNIGWHLVLHGSLKRDLDIFAIPWEDDAVTYDVLIKELFKVCNRTAPNAIKLVEKKYGRKAYTIPLDIYKYIDLSLFDNRI